MKIAIIDYKMSNLFSIMNALYSLQFKPEIISSPESLKNFDAAILPGVGSFPNAIDNLKKFSLDESIIEFISTGKPFMGICLGMQLLFERSEEFEGAKGLSIIEGSTIRFDNHKSINTIPHVGWNSVRINNKSGSPDRISDIKDGEFFYFVHSLYVKPVIESQVKTYTTHDKFTFCSSVSHENIFASQFHPEKSGEKGLRLLRSFFS
ncbi:imidazole glycerol phosphate synthase subunit HisH [Gammaproteobacteria bacterium]|nr:imidazole glycerol phosphate synthase subunit HisH [Gammaproteobacteria bacterium]